MKVFKAGFGLLMLFALISPPLCITADAQYRVSLKDVLKRLEEDTDQFTKSLNYDLDHGPLNGTTTEDEINRYVHEFEEATDHLKDRYDDPTRAPNLAREVLVRGRSIDTFMRRHRPGGRSMSDWQRVRHSLDIVAAAYKIKWRW
jgi:hypothetical protein